MIESEDFSEHYSNDINRVDNTIQANNLTIQSAIIRRPINCVIYETKDTEFVGHVLKNTSHFNNGCSTKTNFCRVSTCGMEQPLFTSREPFQN